MPTKIRLAGWFAYSGSRRSWGSYAGLFLCSRSFRSRSLSSMSPSSNSSGEFDCSKSRPMSSTSLRLVSMYSQPSLMCSSSKEQTASTMMCQGSSIPHSCRRRLYNRPAQRVRFPNSLGEGPPSKSSNTSNSFRHVYHGGAALMSRTLPRCANYDLISRGRQHFRTISEKSVRPCPKIYSPVS